MPRSATAGSCTIMSVILLPFFSIFLSHYFYFKPSSVSETDAPSQAYQFRQPFNALFLCVTVFVSLLCYTGKSREQSQSPSKIGLALLTFLPAFLRILRANPSHKRLTKYCHTKCERSYDPSDSATQSTVAYIPTKLSYTGLWRTVELHYFVRAEITLSSVSSDMFPPHLPSAPRGLQYQILRFCPTKYGSI